MQKLDDFYQVHKNVIFERAWLNRQNQHEGESAEEYITCLYNLIKNCKYGDLKSEMIRDRLIVGIRNSSLSERLQTDAAFALEKAKTVIRQREAVKSNSSSCPTEKCWSAVGDQLREGKSVLETRNSTSQAASIEAISTSIYSESTPLKQV